MHRLVLAALAAPLLCAGVARAQSESQAKPPAGSEGGASKAASDKQLQEAVQKEVAKIKEELREEIRAEMQGAQAAAAFLGTPEEKPKLEFLELHGYMRLRDYLYDNVDLRRDADPWGYYLYPRPVINPQAHGTITTANTRFRVEPTLNVSDEVRVRAQVDLLDNLVLGSTPELSQWSPNGFLSTTQVPPQQGFNSTAAAVAVKRVWGEVQTPVGLLSFGRMPDRWGLGILANPGSGIDDDYGDNVDRIQFAIPLGGTPLGPITLIPMFDFVATSLTSAWAPEGSGLGQPFDLEQYSDARAIGLKILRLDSDDELKRKLDKGLTSFNWGLWYSYRSQTFDYPQGYVVPGAGQGYPASVRRDASAHVVDLWTRYESRRFHFEAEATGVYGQIGNISNVAANPLGPVLLRQFGGTAQGAMKFADGRLHLGGEVGIASGDRDPGFGNLPGRQPPIDPATGLPMAPVPGIIDGPQYAAGDGVYDIRNFRFNRAYRVDQVLWREILGNVTDAFYVKPTLTYEMLPGVVAKAQLVYSQAIYASSTPSTAHTPLGVEPDVEVSYASDDGFLAWLQYGVLFPLAGLGYIPGSTKPDGTPHTSLSPGHAIRVGLAVRY